MLVPNRICSPQYLQIRDPLPDSITQVTLSSIIKTIICVIVGYASESATWCKYAKRNDGPMSKETTRKQHDWGEWWNS